jgi:hypothetical protein
LLDVFEPVRVRVLASEKEYSYGNPANRMRQPAGGAPLRYDADPVSVAKDGFNETMHVVAVEDARVRVAEPAASAPPVQNARTVVGLVALLPSA